MGDRNLFGEVFCALVEACRDGSKRRDNGVCRFLLAIDENWKLCREPLDINSETSSKIWSAIEETSIGLEDSIDLAEKIISQMNKTLEDMDIARRLALAILEYLAEHRNNPVGLVKGYKLAGMLHSLLLKTAGIIAARRELNYINVLIIEVVNKKNQLTSTRRPLDVTRTSLIMSDSMAFVASRLPALAEKHANAESLGLWSILRPNPIINPYNYPSYMSRSIINELRDKLINIGGFQPAILTAVLFSKEPLPPVTITSLINNEIYNKYWMKILRKIFDNTMITSRNARVLVSEGRKIVELLASEEPVPYIITVKPFKLIGTSFSPIEVLRKSFDQHERASPSKYVEYNYEYTKLLDEFLESKSISGNPLCSNCYSRPAVVVNSGPEPTLVKLEKSKEGGLRAGLRPRERLCPYHFLLRLERSGGTSSFSDEPLFLGAITGAIKPKSVYGIASFYFRILIYLMHLIMINHNLVNRIDTTGKLKECLGIDKFKEILDSNVNYALKLEGFLRPEQSLGETCKLIGKSSNLGKICEILNSDNTQKTLDYLSYDQLKLHELLATLAVHYPELLYPGRVKLLKTTGGEGLAGELEKFYRRLATLLRSNTMDINCLLQIAKLSSLRFRPSNYYALVYIDADDAHKLFSGELAGLKKSLESSLYLLWEELRSEALSRVILSGIPLFVGGDDIMFLVPPEDAFNMAASFYSIARNVGLTSSMAILFAHTRVPMRSSISALFEAMEASKGVSIDGRDTKNSVTIARITGTGKRDIATLPLIPFRGDAKTMSKYFASLLLVNRLLHGLSLRRALRDAIREASLGGFRQYAAYEELSKLIQKSSTINLGSSFINEKILEASRLILEVIDLVYGLRYTTRASTTKLNGFEELLKASLIVLEPEILGESILSEWAEVHTR